MSQPHANPSRQTIGVVGAGTMGRGIAQTAATAGHPVVLYDLDAEAREAARQHLHKIHRRLVDKGRLSEAESEAILQRIGLCNRMERFSACSVVVEAVVEDLEIKRQVFRQLEEVTTPEAVLATNTSSLSVTALSAACQRPVRVAGAHFFNPVPLMPLVEVIPGLETAAETVSTLRQLLERWGKTVVEAQDTPGFIVNRVARPFYGESLRLVEEGIASPATVDWALKELGGFPMGPFELMDLVGNDVSLKVTETVFHEMGYDPRYRPSLLQRRLVQAGRLGRKSGRGFYDYRDDTERPAPEPDRELAKKIFRRVLVMLINEAADAVHWRVASAPDIDLAMTTGVRYPKGLLAWCDELGAGAVLEDLEALHREYGEDRYRPSPLLRRLARDGGSFHRSPEGAGE
ncbi:MAG: 3-hydroxyacyl-CoA dehydrogenase NAD-binding domain-containing protein [Acidobacteriota bacterium]|nr:3-hydroxyacyl-CoA dehydrogenase NAD-binding domain-containing protein [Acidobacteriota bacterium]